MTRHHVAGPYAKAEAPILWPPDVKSWLFRKDPDAGKNWRQEEKGSTEDEMAGWHHRLNGHEFEQSSRRWWRTGKPGVLQSMGLWRVGHNWVTEQQQSIPTIVSSQHFHLLKKLDESMTGLILPALLFHVHCFKMNLLNQDPEFFTFRRICID